MHTGFDLDDFDHAILRHVATDGRIAVVELARRIGLSKSPDLFNCAISSVACCFCLSSW